MNEDQFHRAATLLSQHWASIHPDAPFPLELHQSLGSSVTFLMASSIPLSLLQPSNLDHIYDISVAFSHSYRCPVLFFRGYKTASTLLSYDEMAIDFPCWSRDFSFLSDGDTFISPEIHPGCPTSSPWLSVHPCQAQTFMGILGLHLTVSSNDSELIEFITSWLRVVGPVVGLKLPVEKKHERLKPL